MNNMCTAVQMLTSCVTNMAIQKSLFSAEVLKTCKFIRILRIICLLITILSHRCCIYEKAKKDEPKDAVDYEYIKRYKYKYMVLIILWLDPYTIEARKVNCSLMCLP
jgi:hypothetical protein